jgi:4-amino-4-deoxy-L-arabinose transferase-like glycosyltransferase
MVALLALASVFLFLLNTRQGIGILPDSTRYMRLVQTPYDAPLYTWSLAAFEAIGVSMVAGAKLLGLVLVIANTLLIWQLLIRGTGSLVAAAGGTALIIFAPQFVGVHALAMSEPLFLFTLFVTVLLFLRYLTSERGLWLILCGITLALTMLVRFTALPLGAAFAVILLADRRHAWSTRLRNLLLLGGVGASIFFTWVIASELTTGHAVGRALAFYGNADMELWLGGLKVLTAYLLPVQVPAIARLALLLLVIGATTWLCIAKTRSFIRADEKDPGDAIPVIFGLFALFYVGFMFLSVSIEANLQLNARYTLPFYIALVITAASAAFNRQGGGRLERLLAQALACVALLVLASHAVRTAVQTRENFQEGIGYASTAWTTSPIVRAVDALPHDATVFTNAPDPLNYLTPRYTLFIPFRTERRTGIEDPANPLARQMAELRARLAAGNAYVVFVDKIDWRFYLVTEAELRRSLDLKLIRREDDGRIYALKALP